VDLVQVDVVGAQPGERAVDLLQDGLAGQAPPPGPGRIGQYTLVASTMSSRRVYLRSARPVISSEVPWL